MAKQGDTYDLGSVVLNEHNLEQLKWRLEQREDGFDPIEAVAAWLWSFHRGTRAQAARMLDALGLVARPTPQGMILVRKKG